MKRLLPFIIMMLGITTNLPLHAQELTGKSFINITKGTTGGTYEPGDILEIRATIAVPSNLTLSRFRFVDTVSMDVTYITGSLKIVTNEGLTFRSYTDAAGDDAGMYNSSNRTVRINMGSAGAGAAGGVCSNTDPGSSTGSGGTIAYNGRPSFFGNTCIMSAAYQVQVNPGASIGNTITLSGGTFWYRKGSTNTSRSFSSYTISLSDNLGLCGNSVGANAVLEDDGTFGSGSDHNRTGTVIGTAYEKVLMTSSNANIPNDGQYAVVNNLSPNQTTNTAIGWTSPARVFGAWDIIGDHTASAPPEAGNAPTPAGQNGGYFVVINASYANGEAFRQDVSGLCGDTYYEFSAWFRNVCSRCASDTMGRGSTNAGFTGSDPAGVLPNLGFEIDGVAYYSTGNIEYDGNWVKKGFIFKTAPGQTSFTIGIRNNAPGGGGNDWAIDDITFGTCSPQLTFNPSPIATVCAFAEAVNINATVSSYFDNYRFWEWEMSTDDGSNWSGTGVSGETNPNFNNPNYEYDVAYPSFLAGPSDSGNLYRLRIATSSVNLANNGCSYANGTNILTLQVNECEVLNAEIRNFSAQLRNQQATLRWQLLNAAANTRIFLEKSTNNQQFKTVANFPANLESYQWNDSDLLNGPTYYRIRLEEGDRKSYSDTKLLNPSGADFSVRSVRNPFVNEIQVELASQKEGTLILTLTDLQGRKMKEQRQTLKQGVVRTYLRDLGQVPQGMYILRIDWNGEVFYQKVVK